jgi:hypothetical protein
MYGKTLRFARTRYECPGIMMMMITHMLHISNPYWRSLIMVKYIVYAEHIGRHHHHHHHHHARTLIASPGKPQGLAVILLLFSSSQSWVVYGIVFPPLVKFGGLNITSLRYWYWYMVSLSYGEWWCILIIWVNYHISLTWIVRPFGDDFRQSNHGSRVRENSEVVIIYPDTLSI